ncbi:SEL1-like repeat protein [Aurantiacibacter flavus]|uniref:SEL1-like repeat protein n=1 Tax=Aurantiacibacter flavus TaxID=3145232 RepID=A0ABV0CWH6_9SPHN
MTALLAALLALQAPIAAGGADVLAAWSVETLADTEAAAKRGDKIAQYELGRRYEEGDGVDRDLERALRWYTRAAKSTASETSVYSGPVGSERHGRAIGIRNPNYRVGLPAAAFRADAVRQMLKDEHR